MIDDIIECPHLDTVATKTSVCLWVWGSWF